MLEAERNKQVANANTILFLDRLSRRSTKQIIVATAMFRKPLKPVSEPDTAADTVVAEYRDRHRTIRRQDAIQKGAYRQMLPTPVVKKGNDI
jgi:hypothetical protein